MVTRQQTNAEGFNTHFIALKQVLPAAAVALADAALALKPARAQSVAELLRLVARRFPAAVAVQVIGDDDAAVGRLPGMPGDSQRPPGAPSGAEPRAAQIFSMPNAACRSLSSS
ncbi:hypothetical protein GGER_41000 [Serratia rubidaea]